jgi:hypothetical protein
MASSIKVSYDGEMRRFAASTYEDLQRRVTQLFDITSFLLKYQDEDNDMVTVSSEWELEEALRCQGPVLRLNVEVADERSSGDFILVQRDMVMHVQDSGEEPACRSPQVTIPAVEQTTVTPMTLTPLPSQTNSEVARGPTPPTEKHEEQEQKREAQAGTKRSYAEVTASRAPYTEVAVSKTPYISGSHKAPGYIISVPSEASCQRPKGSLYAQPTSSATAYTQPSSSPNNYVQPSASKVPYAAGKSGQEFVKSPKPTTPYAQGKPSPQSFALPSAATKPYASPSSHPPFTQAL